MKEDKGGRCEKASHAWLFSLCMVSVLACGYLLYKETQLESRLEELERQFLVLQHQRVASTPVSVPGELLVERYQTHSRVAREIPSDCSCPGISKEYGYGVKLNCKKIVK
ncbi:hypothetical protein J6590_060056 [Homalodisca vitripennis]|nr:hypothetical protein J6590_060056 [Homalodisca vitripennis]